MLGTTERLEGVSAGALPAMRPVPHFSDILGTDVVRILVRPLGYLAFVVALSALAVAARILGEKDELGFFSARLAKMLWAYPEVTRRGVQTAWMVWAVLFVVAITPIDPIATPWDQVALGAVALAVLWRRHFAGHQAER
jgi:hypothetical protein